MNPIEEVQRLLIEGRVNDTDKRHADELVNRTAAGDLTTGNLNWLTSLAKREGARFVKP